MYVIGQNESGELGLGNTEAVFKLIEHSKHGIKNIICGYQYKIYIDYNNNYWSAGYNSYGTCSINKKDDTITKLEPITYFNKNKIKIKKICASIAGFCTFWITNDNKLYGNGSNKNNQLGIDNKYKYIFEPILIPFFTNLIIIDAVSADDYSLVLCSIKININMIIKYWSKLNINNIIIIPNDIINLIKIFYGNTNYVYSTPYSIYGGDGHGNDNDNIKCKWKIISKLKDKQIIKVAAGDSHSLFLECNGNIWCCGRNSYGQLGLGYKDYNNNNKLKPQQIKYFNNNNIIIKDISCGPYHNLAIDNNNNVYSWGRNEDGQCGNGRRINIYLPKLIISLNNYKIKNIKCGWYHSYISTNNGYHYLFGYNYHNECIKKHTDYVLKPYLINKDIGDKINNKKIKSVYLGCRTTILIVDQ